MYSAKWEKKKIAVLIGFLQAAAASLLALLQLHGTLAIKISQEQMKLHYLIANLVASPNMALEKIRRARYRYLSFVYIYIQKQPLGFFWKPNKAIFG